MISIIMPAYQAEKTIADSIRSVLAQSFQDWELIIIDSHSTDGTWEFLNRISSSRPIFRYQIPKGLYQAWNFGISKARGTYVYIATADDIMKPDCLEKMTAALEAHPECGICDTMLQLLDARIPGSSLNPEIQRITRGKPHLYVLNKAEAGELSLAATCLDPDSGRTMEVYTTENGVQLYTGNWLSGFAGAHGATFPARSAVCFEAQCFPDTPNKPHFPSAVLLPGDEYQQVTIYKFGVTE